MIAEVSFADLLALPAVQRSFVALLIAAVGLPIVGVLIVGLDIVTVRFAVMHLALLGVALGLWAGIDPVVAGVVVATVAAGSLAPLADRPGGLSGPMGFLMTMAIAAALLVLSVTGVNATGAFELLWGSVLATRPVDLWLLGGVTAAVLALILTRRRAIALMLYDREVALTSGVPVRALVLVVLLVVAASISSAIRLTGALLVDSLTLLPALAARNIADSFTSMLLWAVGLGLVGNLGGFVLALALDQPPGPVLVLTAGTITIATYLVPSPRTGATR